MNLAEFVNEKPQQPLPEALTSREADLYAFQNYCNNLMLKILTLFAIGLNVGTSTIPGCLCRSAPLVSNIFRLIISQAAETGSLLAIEADPAVALFDSSNTPPSQQTATSTPQSTSEPEHTQITAPSRSSSNAPASQVSKSSLQPPRSPANETQVTTHHGRPSLSSPPARNPTPVRRF